MFPTPVFHSLGGMVSGGRMLPRALARLFSFPLHINTVLFLVSHGCFARTPRHIL